MIIVGAITTDDCRQSNSAPAIVKVYFQLFGFLPGSSHLQLCCLPGISLGWFLWQAERSQEEKSNIVYNNTLYIREYYSI